MSVQSVTFTVNGQTITLTNSEGNTWTGNCVAPSTTSWSLADHAYPCSITATDDAGNSTTKDATDATLGASLKLRVLEKVAPTVTIVYPAAGAYVTASGRPTFEWTLSDADSGVDESSVYITLDGDKITSGITITTDQQTGVKTCQYTPAAELAEGSHTYTVGCSDNDGNDGVSASTTFTVDTIRPTLNVSAPVDNLITNLSNVTIEGTTDDATTKPVTVTVNSESVTVDPSTGAFSKTMSLSEGSNIFTIVATDTAGNTTTVTRTVIRNTVAPTIVSVTLVPNPADAGATFIVTAVVTDE